MVPMGRDARIKLTIITIITLVLQTSCLIDYVGGAFTHEPEEMQTGLSPRTRDFLDNLFTDIQPGTLTDYHTHMIGIGTNNSGAFVNPHMQSWLYPKKRIRYGVYKSAFGIKDMDNADREYVERLVRLIRSIPKHGRHHILAFDKHYNNDGTVNPEYTEFYTPNSYVMDLAEEFPDVFLPTISVHPYRPDAVEALEKWAKRGARHIKWLPNAMNISPADERCIAYFRKMKEYDMVLLTHTGEEQAVDADEFQLLGNPQLFRIPLDMGVKVVMAHAASLGRNFALDDPEKNEIDSFDLVMEMMKEEKYRDLLYVDISATTQFNRLPRPLATLIERKDLHGRIVNGSDYPLPAVNIVLRTRNLASEGFITDEERGFLNEIYDYNPMLYDFAIKRTLRHPETGARLPLSLFLSNPNLPE